MSKKSPAAVGGPKISVKEGNFRGARQAWYERLKEYEGKPLADYVKSCTDDPPSLPQKGKGAGKAEKPSGWVSFFVREKVLELSE